MFYELTDVSVRHSPAVATNVNALDHLTLSIRQGEQVALIGPSGAGKTTLLHTLALAHRPTAGTISVAGVDPWTLPNRSRHTLRRKFFLAPQTPPMPPRQRVVTAVLAGCLPQWSAWQALSSLVRPRNARAAFDALARFNLQDKLYARVDRLSGGERQRCGMARLLVSQAQMFLVDEPLSALDPTLAMQTLSTLQQEAATRNATLVCSLHQVDLARANFARLIGLRDGKVMFDAPSSAVSDAMIDSLYRDARDDRDIRSAPALSLVPAAELIERPAVAAVPRCF